VTFEDFNLRGAKTEGVSAGVYSANHLTIYYGATARQAIGPGFLAQYFGEVLVSEWFTGWGIGRQRS
jgi:hypothetical protein